ncbi:MAG: type II toxin-antitoxin system PemK/MazF family toxin [Defluviitaleaceae bacterium]|nr:type II toxin-antitoxin system PemK/MazF family toxin [Defluviitaleaceae bacterium]
MVNKWDICFCTLDPTQGSEQRGTRPVLIVSNNAVNHSLPVSTVLPLSAFKPSDMIYPTEILLDANTTGLPKDSVAMVQQIRTVSHTRLEPPTRRLSCPEAQQKVLKSLRTYFEL